MMENMCSNEPNVNTLKYVEIMRQQSDLIILWQETAFEVFGSAIESLRQKQTFRRNVAAEITLSMLS